MAKDKAAFILQAITEYKTSDMYKTADAAQAYYRRENPEIMKRLTYLQKHGLTDSKVVFHRLCSGFFPKFVKQLSQYLLGNGVTLSNNAKSKLGDRFDNTLQKMGIQALVDGVNWGFWNVDRLLIFRATEFVPLFDEQTSDLRVGIRFWQLTSDKPLYVELYKEDGITKFKSDGPGGALIETASRQAYKQKFRRDIVSEELIDTENYPTIPIVPLYANELKISELTTGIKSMIDAFDFINSDFVDGITQIEGLYWTIKNFGGDDVAELLMELQQLKATATDPPDSEVTPHVVEIPHEAKEIALALLKRQLYADFMALDTETISGGSLTNVAINVATTDFGLKADIFEWQCVDFIIRLLSLLGVNKAVPQFKRRSISNDTEWVNMFSTMLSDGAIDIEYYVRKIPVIADEDQEELLKRLGIAAQEEADETFPIEDEEMEGKGA